MTASIESDSREGGIGDLEGTEEQDIVGAKGSWLPQAMPQGCHSHWQFACCLRVLVNSMYRHRGTRRPMCTLMCDYFSIYDN